MRHTQETIDKIMTLHQAGIKSRKIAKEVLGSSSKKSSVNDIIARQRGEDKGEETQSSLNIGYVMAEEGVFITDRFEVLATGGYVAPLKQEKDNSVVLLISDLHIPYHHQDSIKFLQHLKDKYQPTRVICLGDELDKHALSYHDSDPDLPSAGDEIRKSLPVVKGLFQMFPEMDVLESNHGSLVWRKAKTHGVPRHYLKSYNDVLGVDDGWQWHFDLTIDLPGGKKCYFHHGKTTDVTKLSQQMGMCAVQGHYHEKFKVEYWGNPTGLYWGLQVGCLIDDDSYAFSYNNVNIKRPVLGTALIVNGHPILEPMVLDHRGRWVGQ